jgi:hypothetical protein
MVISTLLLFPNSAGRRIIANRSSFQCAPMVRRRKEGGIDLFLAAPWWVSAVVAVAGFIAFQWIVPAVTAYSPILKVFGPAFKPFGYFLHWRDFRSDRSREFLPASAHAPRRFIRVREGICSFPNTARHSD